MARIAGPIRPNIGRNPLHAVLVVIQKPRRSQQISSQSVEIHVVTPESVCSLCCSIVLQWAECRTGRWKGNLLWRMWADTCCRYRDLVARHHHELDLLQ